MSDVYEKLEIKKREIKEELGVDVEVIIRCADCKFGKQTVLGHKEHRYCDKYCMSHYKGFYCAGASPK